MEAKKQNDTFDGSAICLAPAEIIAMAEQLPEWTATEQALTRKYQFKDFRAAMAFVNQIADIAEAQQQHPDIFISYNKVELTLSTHKVGGVTHKDFLLAEAISKLKSD